MTLTIGIDCRKVADFGIGTYIRGLLSAFARTSTDEEFVLFGPESLSELVPAGDERFILIEERSRHYSIEELASLERQLERFPVDVFHAPHYVTPFGNTRMVVTIHDLIHLDYPSRNPLAIAYARWMIGRSVRKSQRILTPSATVAASIAKRFPKARGRITVTPNGVDPGFFTPPEPAVEQALHARLGTKSGEYFLFIGNDKPHKNVELLVRTFRETFAGRPAVRLMLVGASFDSYALFPDVACAGFLTDLELHAAYSGAIALIMPSLYEGFGLPVVEAMAAGTPVIISDGGALPEVAGEAGLVFSLEHPSELSGAMRRVAEDAKLRTTLREKGRLRAQSFSWDDTARKTLEVYRAAAHPDRP